MILLSNHNYLKHLFKPDICFLLTKLKEENMHKDQTSLLDAHDTHDTD